MRQRRERNEAGEEEVEVAMYVNDEYLKRNSIEFLCAPVFQTNAHPSVSLPRVQNSILIRLPFFFRLFIVFNQTSTSFFKWQWKLKECWKSYART